MTATKTRAVRCRCKNRDRHFGVCKCHRHKGDTVSELPLTADERPEDGNKFGVEVTEARTDVWWCAKCDREWTVASLPHNPICPRCGTSGWWRRFA